MRRPLPAPHHPQYKGRPTRGFTLVELLVVVVLLGMVSGTVVVSWKTLLPNTQFNSAIRSLSEVLHSTRADAITKNHEFQIHYDLDNDRYWVRTPFNAEGGGFAQADDDPHLIVFDTSLKKEDISIEQVVIDGEPYRAGQIYVRFDPLGASSSHSIHLRQNIFDREFTIEVLPLTGDIRFHDGPFQRDPPEDSDFQ